MSKFTLVARVALVFALLVGAVGIARRLGGGAPRVEVRMERSQYFQGEPIGITVTVLNARDKELVVSFDYRTFKLGGGSGLVLDARAAGPPPRTVMDDWVLNSLGGGLFARKRLAPGGSLTTTVFLQRFADQPRPGRHRIPFTFHLACREAECERLGPDERKGRVDLRAEGVLSFVVLPPSPERLHRSLRSHVAKLRDRDTSKQREGIEALFVTRDPSVIPYLKWELDHHQKSFAILALSKFLDKQEARDRLIEALDSGDLLASVQTLDVFRVAQFRLDPVRIRSLLGRNSPDLTRAVLRFLALSGDPGYYRPVSPQVAHLLASDDLVTAITASLQLKTWGLLDIEADWRVRERIDAAFRSKDDAAIDHVLALSAYDGHPFEISPEDLCALLGPTSKHRLLILMYVRSRQCDPRYFVVLRELLRFEDDDDFAAMVMCAISACHVKLDPRSSRKLVERNILY